MEQGIQSWPKVLLAVISLLVGTTVLGGQGHALWGAIDRNYQMTRVCRSALEAVQADGFVSFTPELATLTDELEQRAVHNAELAHPILVTLSLWANDLTRAQRWLQVSPVAWQRVIDSRFGWRTVALVPFGAPFWSYSQQMITNMAWLAGMRLEGTELHSEALQWFRRGLSLAPGRVPEDVRRTYYRSLSEWYSTQPITPNNRRLAAKFACLADERPGCLELIVGEIPVNELPDWTLTDTGVNSWVSKDGSQILGFDLDEDILAAGVDVVGVLYWQTEKEDKISLRHQSFIASNLAPNPGFEFQNVFVDGCVDGYIGSHAFVLPCVSHIVDDPLQQRKGLVATTQTSKTGYLLIGAPVRAGGEQIYALGAQICSIAGANAKLGMQFTSDKAARENAYSGLSWPITDSDMKSPACWSREARIVIAPIATEAARIWLGGFEDPDSPQAEAMFDNVFLFDLSELHQDPID